MIIGTTIMHDGSGTNAYYSPVFPRGGLAALFSLDVTHVGGTPSLDVDVEHKNADDTSFTSVGAFTTITTVGVKTKDLSSLKEQIRFKYTYSAGSLGDFMHVIVAAPAWRPYA